HIYNQTGASNYVMSLIRFLFSAGILIVPTTLMGATLPVLSRFLVRTTDKTGSKIGSLYAINTLGAVTGCALAGFLLLGWIGITASERLAAAFNFAIGIVALELHRRFGYTPPELENEQTPEEEGAQGRNYSQGTIRFVLLIFCVSGMAALAYEVLWSRMLVFLLGSSIYSFSMILTTYLFGLTAGSMAFAKKADRMGRPLLVFGWLEILIGLTALCGLVLFRRLPFTSYSLQVNPLSYLTKNLLGTLVVVLPPTFLMGAIFPVAVKVYARRLGAIGRQTGTIYAVNTVGAIIGSFLAGFVMIPLAGSKNSMLLLVLISLACGLSLLFLAMKNENAAGLNWLAAALIILPIMGFPSGNELMQELSVKLLEDRTDRDWKVIDFNEDATAAVAVAEDYTGTRLLTVNGISMTYLHMDTQLMAHLPLALVRGPRNVLVICFGMGTTFVSARSAGMDVDFVELCPYVVEAFKYYQEDPSLLTKPGARKIIEDGRNYLLLSDRTYDVITIDPPPPPYSAGTVNLYTKEFYELCRKRLTPEGIVCQWIPMYSTTEGQYKMLLRTFMEAFPHTSVWGSINGMGTYLVGTPNEMLIEREGFDAYFDRPLIKENLSLYVNEPLSGPRARSLLLLNEEPARAYAADAPVMSDDLPLIEFPLFRKDRKGELMHIGLMYSGHV
ncbi:MAG: fused MFS/spermidine synthase, partial [Candidatus Lindowbacteria bacterium]|nr:fused MFS/spermidine synthase [Candidatus Lindowbacteria bacterium]